MLSEVGGAKGRRQAGAASFPTVLFRAAAGPRHSRWPLPRETVESSPSPPQEHSCSNRNSKSGCTRHMYIYELGADAHIVKTKFS